MHQQARAGTFATLAIARHVCAKRAHLHEIISGEIDLYGGKESMGRNAFTLRQCLQQSFCNGISHAGEKTSIWIAHEYGVMATTNGNILSVCVIMGVLDLLRHKH